MASLYTNSKGQWVVEINVLNNRLLQAFPSKEQAEAFKSFAESEVAVSRSKKELTPFLQNLVNAKAARATEVSAKKTSTPTVKDLEDTPKPDTSKRHGPTLAASWKKFITEKSLFVELGTLNRYADCWNVFNEFAKPNGITHLEQVDRSTMVAFVDWSKKQTKTLKTQQGKRVSRFRAASINANVRHLRTFFNWMVNNDYLAKSPMKGKFDQLRTQQQRKPYLLLDEVEALMEEAEKRDRNKHLYFALDCFGGLRASEIHLAQWCHIPNLAMLLAPSFNTLLELDMHAGRRKALDSILNEALNAGEENYADLNSREGLEAIVTAFPNLSWMMPQGSLNVLKSKTKISRAIPLSDSLKEVLFKYAPERKSDEEYIVHPESTEFNRQGYRFSNRNIMRATLKGAGLQTVNRHGMPQKVTPHIGRYTFASLLLNSGMEADIVRRYLGHTQQQMTDHYAYLMPEAARVTFGK